MLFHPKDGRGPGRLQQRIRCAETVPPDLVSDIIAEACVRLPALGQACRAHINRLIESAAWTDLAVALVEAELPQWRLRRLVYEDGEWHCCLSSQPNLPLGLFDDTIEARHEVLALAILSAFLEAPRTAAATALGPAAVPPVRPAAPCAIEDMMCCDNFS
jgi:hypothetical protein